jgi:hypothetical protein
MPAGLVEYPIRDMKNLQVGDKFVVYWAKDDDPVHSLRCDFETQAVHSIKDGVILTVCAYEWDLNDNFGEEHNAIDTSRGTAYFYKARE